MGVVDEIKSRLDIIDVVSGYVPSLKKTGRTYKGLCPFHSEKTPSFVVFPDTQSWHCFGACSTGGDVVGFVMRQEGLEFRETLELLAQRTGITLRERQPSEVEADKQRQKLLDLVATAASYFHQQLLQAPQAEFTRQYVAQRGLSQETVVKFQLGYALNQWEALKSALNQRGYADEDLVSAGLLVARDDGSPGYDRFRDRFMVPIRNLQGQVVGFGARALHPNQQPKYLNSPQSDLFDKSTLLYGLDVAKNTIRHQNEAVIVEGYMDALQAQEQGFENVVAQMGTALTETQLKTLNRFAKRLVIALDADTAGNAAALRRIAVARQSLGEKEVAGIGADGLVQYGQNVETALFVASLPPGKDPDDILRDSPSTWATLIETATPVMDYYLQTVTATLDLETAQGKSAAVKTIIPVLRQMTDRVQQAHYLQQLATLVKIDERTLKAELQRDSAKTAPQRSAAWPVAPPASPTLRSSLEPTHPTPKPSLENHCLATLIGLPHLLHRVNQALYNHQLDVISTDDFQRTENKALFLIIKRWAEQETRTLDELHTQTDEHLEGQLASLLALWYQQPADYPLDDAESHLLKLLLRLRLQRVQAQNQNLRKMTAEAHQAEDKTQVQAYQTLTNQVVLQLHRLNLAKNALSALGQRRSESKTKSY
jgi:DNA primase